VPTAAPPTATIGITAGEFACSADATAWMFAPFRFVTETGAPVCVSLLPAWKIVTWRDAGRFAHGVSGPITSGLYVPATRCSIPMRCNATVPFAAVSRAAPGARVEHHAVRRAWTAQQSVADASLGNGV